MGNAPSQPKEEEGYDTNNDTFEQEQQDEQDREQDPEHPQDSHLASEDFAFSSQINSSIGPAFLPPSRPNKAEFSSSPASRLYSSQAPTPVPRRKMSDSSPYKSSPAFHSSADLGIEPNGYENSVNASKKKRRNKKRRSSASQPDGEHQSIDQQASPELDNEVEQDHSEIVGDIDMIDGEISASAQARRQQKRERKESKRAARLAKQKAEASPAPEPHQEEESRFRDLWLSQEARIAAKREQDEDQDDPTHIVQPPELIKIIESDEHVESSEAQNAMSKKRKRKSQTPAEHELRQASKKKHKKLHNPGPDIATEPTEQSHEDGLEESEAPNDDNNFDKLAEQLDSGRKKIFHHLPIEQESSPSIESGPELEAPMEDIDDYPRVVSDLPGNVYAGGKADSAVDSEVEEVYRDDDIDEDYDDSVSARTKSAALTQAPHHTTTRRQSASSRAPRDPVPDVHSGELVVETMQDEVAGPQQQNDMGINEDVAPSDNGGLIYDIEVPSSLPLPRTADDSNAKNTKRRASIRTSTGRKRVVKPDFFSRLVEEDIGEDTDSPSPSTAARSRKAEKAKGKQVIAEEEESRAAPSTANGKSRQPKISSMLTDGPYSDAGGAVTPSGVSTPRSRGPKTPATISGAFSDFEIQSLGQVIERFRDDHGLSQYQVNELIHSNPKESKAGELWENVIATTPGRTRQKVINVTRRRFHNFVARGTWTAEQDQELRDMYEQYGNKYAQIGHFINRHPEDIRDRIRNYIVCGDKLKKDQWSQEEADRLMAIVEQAIEEIRRMRAQRGIGDSRPVDEDINWQLVSQGMGRTRSRMQCMNKWKAIKPQLAGGGLDGETIPTDEVIQQARETATTMSYRNRSLVIKEILKSGVNADSRIPWLRIRNELGGQWNRPSLMVVWFRLRRALPNWQSLNVKETCTLLTQTFQHTHKLEYPTEEDNILNYDVEYREIEYKIKKGRKANPVPKSAAFVTNTSDAEDDEELGEAEAGIASGDELGDEVTEGVKPRHSSIDLSAGDKEREVPDSEPETQARSRTRRRRTHSGARRLKSKHIPQDDFDDQSSDTNASQVSSIPAR
ncbi:hypothetical protein NPX13_g6544 [Xylaria arbuscula]|uniref:Myb-like domain-containing protein n=1 Tax=Xylaria arbuscula TaxID=114810 RepID=A0A9W8TK12_9PEZI|nr:hypothetical protein NPX13_g6544 [Xylaria arbuscula]